MTWGFIGAAAITTVGGIVASNKSAKAAGKAIDAQTYAAELESENAKEQMAMQKEQFNYFKDRQVGIDATANKVTEAQLAQAEETQAQGRDLYNYQKEVFRPVEQSLVSQAMRDSTPQYYEQYAQQAVAKQASANANAQGQMERNMASMGVNPNSGAYMANQRSMTLANAAGLGAVANDARDRAEALSWAHKADVAGLGKGLVGAGNASYGLATNSGNSAVNAQTSANDSAAGAQGTAAQYGGLAVNGLQGASKSFNSIYQNISDQNKAITEGINAGAAGIGSIIGRYQKSGGSI
jgi:hypothetical protein